MVFYRHDKAIAIKIHNVWDSMYNLNKNKPGKSPVCVRSSQSSTLGWGDWQILRKESLLLQDAALDRLLMLQWVVLRLCTYLNKLTQYVY